MATTNLFSAGTARAGAGTRRYLTIQFSDLCGSTRIAGMLENEDYSDLIERLRTIYHEVTANHGGSVVQISGDGMLAIYGHPRTGEGDVRAAVHAALDLHEAVRGLCRAFDHDQIALRLHTGIHAGVVLLGAGDAVRGRFELLGTATNIASRLCAAAAEDEVLISEATLGAERNFFDLAERRLLALRGVDELVAAFRILGRAPVTSRYAARSRGIATPFVGREVERGRLRDSLKAAMAGTARFAAINGPPGVGKTRLAEEALRYAGALGWQVHRGECEDAGEPLQPLLHLARSILGSADAAGARAALAAIDPTLAEFAPALLRLLSLDDGEHPATDSPSGEEMTAALKGLFVRLAARRPLVLFIDDWHWADDASRQLIDALRRDDAGTLLILVTARGEASPDDDAQTLAPFSDTETAEAVARLLVNADPFLVAEVSAATGGNALFIEELCHSIAHGREDRRPRGSAWLDMLIGARFARLSAQQAEIAGCAAVIGNVVPCWLLELATGRDAGDPLIASLAQEDFIFPGERAGTLRFKHGITRDAVYNAVGARERRSLHRRIADALHRRGAESGEDELFERLAYHCSAAGDMRQAAHYAELAGDKAMAVSALDRAQSQYRAALAALDQQPVTAEAGHSWGQIAQKFGLAGVFDPSREQLALFRRAVDRARAAGDPAALAWAEYWLGYISYGLGEARAAIAHCERAEAAARSIGNDRLIVQVRATLGQALAAASDYASALTLLDQAIAVKRSHRTGTRPSVGFAYSLACRGFILADLGRFDEADAQFDEAMAAVRGAQHEVEASVLCQRSAACLWQGRIADARRFASEAERVAERVRTRYLLAMSRALGGYARWLTDRDPAAIDRIAEATAWLEASGRAQFTSLNHGWLADALQASGRIAEARRHAARAALRARKGDRLGEAMAWRALARAAAQGHGRLAPDHYLARARSAADARQSPHEQAATLACAAEIADMLRAR